MRTDFRALCAELVVLAEESISYRARVSEAIKLVDRARTALAEPADAPAAVAEQPRPDPPAEGEVAELVAFLKKADWPPRYRNVFGQWASIARAAPAEPADAPAVPEGRGPAAVVEDPSDEELIDFQNEWFQSGRTEIDVTEFQRATLARWGQPPAPPAEGEVAELVAWLHGQDGGLGRRAIYARAAELLERCAAPVPVAVAERLPGPEDCDAEGRCWLQGKVEGDWRLINPAKSGVPRLRYYFSHWLPAHALPLPAQGGEVE